MDKHRRKILKNSAILGVAGGLASVSSIFGLQGCDSKKSQTTQSKAENSANVDSANSTTSTESKTQTNTKGATMEFVTLNNGIKMPILGYGVYQIDPKDTQRCVEDAISVGYRSIDTAQAYFNEAEVGAAIKAATNGDTKREELFITTKVWINNFEESKALKSIETSLKKLQVDYLDLLLIHQPFGDTYGAWRAMSKLHKEGMIKSIGVSNFYPDRLVDFYLNNEIKPALNQIECNPYFARVEYQKFMQDLGIKTESWASFAEGKNDIFTNPLLTKIGAQYGKTPAQVILRWLIQRGVIVIPKTTRKERMLENISVFDFVLSDSDIAQIATLDTGKSLFIDHSDPKIVKWLVEAHKDRF